VKIPDVLLPSSGAKSKPVKQTEATAHLAYSSTLMMEAVRFYNKSANILPDHTAYRPLVPIRMTGNMYRLFLPACITDRF
jgi:hypothetical protein